MIMNHNHESIGSDKPTGKKKSVEELHKARREIALALADLELLGIMAYEVIDLNSSKG